MKTKMFGKGRLLAAGLLIAGLAGAPGALRAAGSHDHGSHGDMKMDHGKMGHEQTEAAVTVTGEVVDLSCYMGHEAKGTKHRKCAKACLLKGLPAGILTDSGELYLVVEKHDKKSQKAYRQVQELAAARVKVMGEKHARNGMMSIAVESVKEIK